MSKKKKNKVKPVESKRFYISRSKFCSGHTTTSDANNLVCFCPYDEEYTYVYSKEHLDKTEYSCGCVRYFNKYYTEFNFHPAIWNDFFDIKLSPGQSNVPIELKIIK